MAQAIRDKLWKDVYLHRNALFRLYSELNALAAISSLPTEIFSLILQYCANDRNGRPQKGNIGDLLSIASVCKQWREIALHTPRVWTRIGPGNGTKHLRTAIRLSKQHLLDVTIDRAYKTDELKLIFNELERIQHLDSTLDIGKFFSANTVLPRLQTLNVESNRIIDCTRVISRLSAPILQSLSLSYFPSCWLELNRFPLLRHVAVLYKPDAATVGVAALETMIGFLQDQRSLRTLVLEEFGGYGWESESDTDSDVSPAPAPRLLPLLEKVQISGAVSLCSALLRRLSLPSLVHVDFSYISHDWQEDAVVDSNIMSAILQVTRCLKELGKPLHLALDGHISTGATLTIGTQAYNEGATSYDDDPIPQLSAHFPSIEFVRDQLLMHLPLDAVRCAVLSNFRDETFLTDLLQKMPHIEELEFEAQSSVYVPLPTLFQKATSPASPPCPNLRVLTVVVVEAYKNLDMPDDPTSEVVTDLERHLPRLEHALQLWVHGNPNKKIERLVIMNYGAGQLSVEQKARLEVYADQVNVKSDYAEGL